MRPTPKFLTDAKGKKVAVLLDIKSYNKLLDKLDERASVIAYDVAKRQEPDYLPYTESLKEIKAARKRKHRREAYRY